MVSNMHEFRGLEVKFYIQKLQNYIISFKIALIKKQNFYYNSKIFLSKSKISASEPQKIILWRFETMKPLIRHPVL